MLGLYNAGAGLSYPYSNVSNLNFSVSLPSLSGFETFWKVTMQENSSDFRYKYALVCDWRTETLWSDLFTTGYNASAQNVSVSGNTTLGFSGLLFPLNLSSMSVFKTVNSPSRTHSRFNLLYIADGNNSIDYLHLDSSGVPVYYLRFNRTGTNLNIQRVSLFPFSITSLVNVTLSSGTAAAFPIGIEYSPVHDVGNNVDFFETRIYFNNVSVTTDDTTSFFGSDLKDVQLFSESVTANYITNITLKSMSLSKISNPNPDFVDFQNGIVVFTNGSPEITPPDQEEILGDGFTIIPGPIVHEETVIDDVPVIACDPIAQFLFPFFCEDADPFYTVSLTHAEFSTFGGNNEFFSECVYDEPGQYTLRHFVTPTTGVESWDVYRDTQVTITGNTSDNSVPLLPDGQEAVVTPDGGSNPVTELFNDFGIGKTMSFVVWFAFAVLVGIGVTAAVATLAGGATVAAGLFGVIVMVGVLLAGWPLGFIPIWFIVMMVLMAAGIGAMFVRSVFSGG